MVGTDSVLAPLEARSSTLFFVAAGLMAVVAGLFTVGGMDTTMGMVAPAAFGAAFLGLLGLYSSLVDRSPWLARAGAVSLGIGVAGALVLTAGHAGQLAGLYAEQPAWVDAANLLLLVGGVILGFGAFGVGLLRTGTQSRTVGLLVLWPPVVFGGVIVVLGTLVLGVTYPQWVHAAHSVSEVVVYLGIGYLVRTGDHTTDRAQATADSPV